MTTDDKTGLAHVIGFQGNRLIFRHFSIAIATAVA